LRLSHGPEVPIKGRKAGRARPLKRGQVDQRARHQLRIWLVICVAISIVLFAIAISNAAYEATTPAWLPFHVLLRKAYSVVAFALVGFSLARTTQLAGRAWTPVQVGLSVGAYSALIEVCQRFLAGAHESLAQQSLDVGAGLLGGALGALIADAIVRRGRGGD
jgi:hypothetical protein